MNLSKNSQFHRDFKLCASECDLYAIVIVMFGDFLPQEGESVSDADDKDSTASEEVEPKLKYVRLTNDLQSILTKDAANCIAVHPKVCRFVLLVQAVAVTWWPAREVVLSNGK